jgi:hypothetical protein
MSKTTWILAAALALPAASALAADQPGTVARVFVTAPKPGMTAQYEAGRKKHMDWHRKQNDSWAWLTWQIETGEASGSYVVGSFGHQWKDFDEWEKKLGTADEADGQLNLAPFSGTSTNGIYTLLADISKPTEGPTPAPMTEVIHYQLNMGAEREFRSAMKKIHEAIQKSGLNWHYFWYELMDGGEHPTYVLAYAMNGWADLAPSDPPFPAIISKAFGEYEAGEILKSIDRSVKSVRSETIRYRPDLSYVPAAK